MKTLWNKISVTAMHIAEFIVFRHPIPSKIVLAILACLSFCLIYGWKVGVIATVAMVIHEYGHILALDLIGIRHAGFFGIPFFGGITIYSIEDVKKYTNQFIVAILGPVVGSAFAGALIIAYLVTGMNWVGATAGLMLIVNLFNMIPVLGLDGGSMYDCIVSGFHPILKRISYGLVTALVAASGIKCISSWDAAGIFFGVVLLFLAILTLIFRVLRDLKPKFEVIASPIMVLLCVVSYMAAMAGMLALLYPLVNVDFISFLQR